MLRSSAVFHFPDVHVPSTGTALYRHGFPRRARDFLSGSSMVWGRASRGVRPSSGKLMIRYITPLSIPGGPTCSHTGESEDEDLACEIVRQIRVKNNEGKSSLSPTSQTGLSQDIYTSQTPVNYEKADPRTLEQNANVRADRANKEHSICLWMKGEHRKRAKMEGKRCARGTQDEWMRTVCRPEDGFILVRNTLP